MQKGKTDELRLNFGVNRRPCHLRFGVTRALAKLRHLRGGSGGFATAAASTGAGAGGAVFFGEGMTGAARSASRVAARERSAAAAAASSTRDAANAVATAAKVAVHLLVELHRQCRA